MYSQSIHADTDIFKKASALLKENNQALFGKTFEEMLEEQAQKTSQKVNEQASELIEEPKEAKKKKEKDLKYDQLPDITKLTKNIDKSLPNDIKNSQFLLEKFKEKKRFDEQSFKGDRQQLLQNPNFAGQPLIQPVYEEGQKRRATKSQILAAWEKFTPVVTEDITKKAVRIDIPLLNDVQALVLRLHPDGSLTASLLGSYVMGELIKQNTDKLDRNLRHHHLSLKEFNVYRSELELNTESGTRRGKKKQQSKKTSEVDLL